MRLVCPHCRAAFDVSDRRPSFCPFCGQALPADDPLSATAPHLADTGPHAGFADGVPEQVGRYRVGRLLGRGGMGAVYEAVEAGSDRRVALKLLASELAASDSAVERFRREGQLASRIAHPRCVFVLAADEDAGRPFIVMELMPGETLRDLVKRDGPLPVEKAVALILDVLEGLRETHRLGLIHRDVKPSNCFLQPDGRVKVGDFGLSKSLMEASELTGTGTFVGTALFASPEQVRKEPLDARTDVYSAAATLYYLLTGRAPFESDDAMATMARIVSSDPPAVREVRPDLSADLERAVLRGLARDRARRWRDVDEFEVALTPFLPGQQAPAGLLARFGAQAVDCSLYGAFFFSLLVTCWAAFGKAGETPLDSVSPLAGFLLSTGWMVFYFGVLEWRWGGSPGKCLFGLRVRKAGGVDRPSFLRNLGRAAVWIALFHVLSCLPDLAWPDPIPWYWGHLSLVIGVAGVLVIVSPMRRRNGYRGLHEWLSGTCVVALARRERASLPHAAAAPTLQPAPAAGDLPPAVGPYVVTGAWPVADSECVLLAEDPKLQRPVCLWLREAPEPTFPARRELARSTRLRWLSAGELAGRRWDAFAAPAGRPLAQAVREGGRLTWKELRPLLGQLSEELDAAGRDGTLPRTLTADQVWVRPGGVELLDFRPGQATAAVKADPVGLLREVAVLALGVTGSKESLRVPPLPLHAGHIVRRLLGEERPYGSAAEASADLVAVADRPAEVSRRVRAAHLVTVGACLVLAHLFTFGTFLEVVGQEWLADRFFKVLPLLLQFWAVWGGLFQGGIGLRLFGLALVGSDGQAASPARCALRSLLVWAPYVLSLLGVRLTVIWIDVTFPGPAAEAVAALAGLLWIVELLSLPVLYLLVGLWRPQRSPFDWLAGTFVVPR